MHCMKWFDLKDLSNQPTSRGLSFYTHCKCEEDESQIEKCRLKKEGFNRIEKYVKADLPPMVPVADMEE